MRGSRSTKVRFPIRMAGIDPDVMPCRTVRGSTVRARAAVGMGIAAWGMLLRSSSVTGSARVFMWNLLSHDATRRGVMQQVEHIGTGLCNHALSCVIMTQICRPRPDPREWARAWSATVGEQVKLWRGRRGLSAQDLADRTEAVSYPVSRNTITALENGRKELLPVQELVSLARALEVAPIILLYPVGEKVEFIMPSGVDPGPHEAARWFSGERNDSADYTFEDLQDSRSLFEQAVEGPKDDGWRRAGRAEAGQLGVHREIEREDAVASILAEVSGDMVKLGRDSETPEHRDAFRAASTLLLSASQRHKDFADGMRSAIGVNREEQDG